MIEFHLHLVSDATGETLTSVARAALAQFEEARPKEHLWPLMRLGPQFDRLARELERQRGVVMFTLVDPDIRDALVERCDDLQIPCISVLDPVIAMLGNHLGIESSHRPGSQHEMNAEYFGRIEALAFTMAHDDGQLVTDFHKADIVLVGVSRTSKTPTSIYLANRGYKAANMPIVPGAPLPSEIVGLQGPLVVGLTVSPDRLIQIRKNRLRSLNQREETDYVDLESVKREITQARRLFTERGWAVIDVTRRSIEETAAEVLTLYSERVTA